MNNRAPKYSKVELLIKSPTNIPKLLSIEKLEFLDCGLIITGDYIIVIVDETDEVNTSMKSTGNIYPLSQVSSYRTYAP